MPGGGGIVDISAEIARMLLPGARSVRT